MRQRSNQPWGQQVQAWVASALATRFVFVQDTADSNKASSFVAASYTMVVVYITTNTKAGNFAEFSSQVRSPGSGWK